MGESSRNAFSHNIKVYISSQLSFRSSTNSLSRLREQLRRLLQLPAVNSASDSDDDSSSSSNSSTNNNNSNSNKMNSAQLEVDAAVGAYLRRAADTFDLGKNVEVSQCDPFFVPLKDPIRLRDSTM